MNASPSVCAPTREGIEAALAAAGLAAAIGTRDPVLVAAGSPLRIVLANPAACALLQAASLEEISDRLLNPARAAGRRIQEIAGQLAPLSNPRLERLRLEFGPRSESLTFLLRRLGGPQAPLFIAVQGAHPALLAGAPVEETLALAPVPASTPAAIAAEPDRRRSFTEIEAELAARFGGIRKVRFLWQTDAEGRLTTLTQHLCEAVGCMTQALIGQDFADVAAALGVEGHEHLRAALRRRDTWSNVLVSWPIQGSAAGLPVSLGALPAFDRGRAFDGFRGYGVIHVTEPQERQLAPPTEAQEPVAGAGPTPGPKPEVEAVAPDEETAPAASVAENAAVAEPRSEAAEPAASTFGENVVQLRVGQKTTVRPLAIVPAAPPAGSQTAETAQEGAEDVQLSDGERRAFREIALALGARMPQGTEPPEASTPAPAPPPAPAAEEPAAPSQEPPPSQMAGGQARDLINLVAQAHGAEVAPEPPSDGTTRTAAPNDLINHLPLGVLVLEGSSVVFVNRTLLDLLGWPDAESFRKEGGLARAFKGREPEALTAPEGGAVPAVTRDGEVVMLDMRVSALERDGTPARLFVFRRENESVNRTRGLELDLRAREAEARELHAILDTATDGVAVLDEDGRILSINRACQALFGYEAGEVTGEPFTALLMRESHALALDYLAGLRTNGVATVLNDGREVLGRARQGGAIQLFMTLGRVGAGGTPKFCAVLRDVTAWKRAERELHEARREAERASAAKSEFLAKVSHEIRTPLNAILGFAEVIMEERFGPVGNARYKDYLKDIHSSGTHVLSLVNDLLDLSKIEAGKMEMSPEPVDANRIVSECVSLMQPQANSERVIVRMSLAPRLPNILSDERSLRQIVLNLLSNAVKFNEPGGQVIVSTALTDAGHAVIRIRDTGIGMSEADLETALEPFRQVAIARKVSGTGLGLPLTKALVEANRASFSIKSRKNEGTLVEVAFPPNCVVTG